MPRTSHALCPYPVNSPPASARFTILSSVRSRPLPQRSVSGKSALATRPPEFSHNVAYNYINTHGKDLHGEPLGKYFIHGLGHYVGLNVHDAGDYDVPLGPGAVFTLEPGIYIPEEKLGVRIEDILYVDPSGKLINLTGNLPHTADDVEHAMAGK